jgi:hypothetical protein
MLCLDDTPSQAEESIGYQLYLLGDDDAAERFELDVADIPYVVAVLERRRSALRRLIDRMEGRGLRRWLRWYRNVRCTFLDWSHDVAEVVRGRRCTFCAKPLPRREVWAYRRRHGVGLGTCPPCGAAILARLES